MAGGKSKQRILVEKLLKLSGISYNEWLDKQEKEFINNELLNNEDIDIVNKTDNKGETNGSDSK